MERWDVVVIGAGIAGVTAVRSICEDPGTRKVLLVNEERVAPYKRTKLSKYVAQGFPTGEFDLVPADWYGEHGVELLTGVRAVAIDRASKVVRLSDESEHVYEKLILATGAAPLYPQTVRPHEAGSFYVLRTEADVERLTEAARRSRRILVDGMGVLAVELAAQLRSMDKQVTLVGAGGQVMPRHLNVRAGEIMEELLTSSGVRLRFQEEILSFEPRKKGGFSVTMIRETGAFDMIVFCIGVAPRTDLARDAGLDVARGILVDEHMRTSDTSIYAAGDCAEHAGGRITDLWHAAEYQGIIAAKNAIGEERMFDDPSFRLKCEVFGNYFFSVDRPREILEHEIEEHENDSRYQCFYFDDDRLVGAVMVNDKERAKEYERAVRERLDRASVLEIFVG